MNKLPKTLRTDHFNLTQIKRDENFAIYLQSKPNQAVAYEVIRIRKHEATEIKNPDGTTQRNIEAGETYPKAPRWGRDGWTYARRPDAERKFSELQKSQEARNSTTPREISTISHQSEGQDSGEGV